MRPGSLDLAFTQGDSYSLTLTFQDDATPPVPLDYSASTFAAQVRENADDARFTAFAVDDTDADTGVIVISLTPDQTRLLPGRAVWDLEMTAAGDPVTLLAGDVRVARDVTRVP